MIKAILFFVKKASCLLMFSFFAISSFAQMNAPVSTIDSLAELLPVESGEERLRALDTLVRQTRFVDPKKGLYYARKLVKEADRYADSSLKAVAYNTVAEVFTQAGVSTDSVKILAEKSLALCEKFENKIAHSNALYRMGQYYKIIGEYETAITYFHKGIEFNKTPQFLKTKANCLHAIGVIKDFQKKYDEAIVYFDQVIDIGHEVESNDKSFIGYQSRAISKCQGGDPIAGIEDFHKARIHTNDLIQEINIRSNLSFAYTLINNLDSAQYYLVDVNNLAENLGNSRQKITASSALIQFHMKQNKLDEAYPFLKQREKYIEEGKSKKWLRSNAEDYVVFYKKKGNYKKALDYQNKYILYNDSILNEKNQFAIKDIEEKYENEKKQLLIEDQELIIQNKNTQRNLFFLIGLLGIAFLLHRIKKNNQIEKQNELINLKEIDRLKKENTIMNLSSMLEGQHAERKRIAQDLHDGLGGLLSSAKLQLNNVKAEIGKLEKMSVFSNAENLIDSAYKEVRRISHDMMPGALVKLGLFAAVEDLAQQINESGKILVQTQWFTEDDDMNEKTKVSLYLIVQEAVTNAVKYADAQHLIIQLSSNDDHYQLTIEDDGKGFDSTDKSNHGIGLNNIQSRVDYLDGQWDIISTADDGVSIEISIPIEATKNDD